MGEEAADLDPLETGVRLDPELAARLIGEIAPLALAVDLRRWRSAINGRSRDERQLLELLRTAGVGDAPRARVSPGAELDLRLGSLPPGPRGVARAELAAELVRARTRLAELPGDVVAARRWVRLRLLAGSMRAHGAATPVLDLEGDPAPAQRLVADAVAVAEGQAHPGEQAVAALARLRGGTAQVPTDPAGLRRALRGIHAERLPVLAPLLAAVPWGGPHPDPEGTDWWAWAESSSTRPAETREPRRAQVRRRLATVAVILPVLGAAAVLTLLDAPGVGRLDSSRLTAHAQPACAACPPEERIAAAGLLTTDDWSAVTIRFEQPPRQLLVGLAFEGVDGGVLLVASPAGGVSLASVPLGAAAADLRVSDDGDTVVVVLPHQLRPTGLRISATGGSQLGSTPTSDRLPAPGAPPLPALGPPAPSPDWPDLAMALMLVAGGLAGARRGLLGTAAALAAVVTALAVARPLSIPAAAGLTRLTGDDRSAAAVAVAGLTALLALALASAALALGRREAVAAGVLRRRARLESMPRGVERALGAIAGAALAAVLVALVALLCVDLGPVGVAATRLRSSAGGDAVVSLARQLLGA